MSSAPAAIRRWLDAALVEGNFAGYAQLAAELRARGVECSRAGVQRYGARLAQRLEAVRASTEAARQIAEAAPDDADLRSAAVMSLIQTETFDVLVALREADGESDPAARLKLLARAGQAIAELSRASVAQKRRADEVAARVASFRPAATRSRAGRARRPRVTFERVTL